MSSNKREIKLPSVYCTHKHKHNKSFKTGKIFATFVAEIFRFRVEDDNFTCYVGLKRGILEKYVIKSVTKEFSQEFKYKFKVFPSVWNKTK